MMGPGAGSYGSLSNNFREFLVDNFQDYANKPLWGAAVWSESGITYENYQQALEDYNDSLEDQPPNGNNFMTQVNPPLNDERSDFNYFANKVDDGWWGDDKRITLNDLTELTSPEFFERFQSEYQDALQQIPPPETPPPPSGDYHA